MPITLNGTTGIELSGNAGITQTGSGQISFSDLTDLTSDVKGVLPVANGGTGITAAGASGNVLTSNGTSWISQSLPSDKTWTSITSNTVYTVPDGKYSIRVYAFGGGGNGASNTTTGGIAAGGAGGGCAFGDIAVTPGTLVYANIVSKNASVTINNTILLLANTGANAVGNTAGPGGTSYKDASVTNGGAYSGAAGNTTMGLGARWATGGSSSGSPLGNGYSSLSADTSNRATGGSGAGGSGLSGGGGAGGAGDLNYNGGGSGGPASATTGSGGISRSIISAFSDPLMKHCNAGGTTGALSSSSLINQLAAGPGAGGGGSNMGNNAWAGGPGGDFGGGGAGVATGANSVGGKGGFGGGGGGAVSQSGTSAVGGDGGYGGGGGGAASGTSATGGQGGPAIILIYV